jgi:hypothetical protein
VEVRGAGRGRLRAVCDTDTSACERLDGSTVQYAPDTSSPTPQYATTPQYTTLRAAPHTLTARYEYLGGQAQGAGQGVVGQQVGFLFLFLLLRFLFAISVFAGPLLLHPRVVARVVHVHIRELHHV